MLVVTHSPQVAARAGHHWRVQKAAEAEHVSTTVIGPRPRRAALRRSPAMLAGATVTDQARAAADSLLAGEA